MIKDTICALCTPPQKGALSLIRISGPKALEITRKQAPFLPQKMESHRAYVGTLERNQIEIDQVVILYFAFGQSFTGEETVEISCHGGEVYNEILQGLLGDGARLAERGEFSLQAFSNGKMDLVQAEGLFQLIESHSPQARQTSFQQLKGLVSEKLKSLEKTLLHLLSHLEADIDFSMEDISTFDKNTFKKEVLTLKEEVQKLLENYHPFENFQKGIFCGIFGPVNSGKSTLFNGLLQTDKAIVSSEEGTTRDVNEGQLRNPKGLNLFLKDTAGFRETTSDGEKQGQRKSKEAFLTSDVQLLVYDASQPLKNQTPWNFFQDQKPKFIVFTKKDLCSKDTTKETLAAQLKKEIPQLSDFVSEAEMFFVSALDSTSLQSLREKLFSFGALEEEKFFITNYRHYKGLEKMKESLETSLQLLQKEEEEKDLLALEMREGLQALYEILGKQIDDRVLDHIFKQFCIGK